MYAPMRMRSLAALALWPVNGRGLSFATLHLPRLGGSNPGMALYVGVACSRRRDLFHIGVLLLSRGRVLLPLRMIFVTNRVPYARGPR